MAARCLLWRVCFSGALLSNAESLLPQSLASLARKLPLQLHQLAENLTKKESGATHEPFASLCAPRDGVLFPFWTQQLSRFTNLGQLPSDRPYRFGRQLISEDFD